jgi:GNAT superfamily N-acetyltransferase
VRQYLGPICTVHARPVAEEQPAMQEIRIRPADAADLGAIVAMLADDPLGAPRETPDDLAPYAAAFARVQADPHQVLVVADRGGTAIGTLQLTYIPGLSRRGATRATIEGVRVAGSARGAGVGARLVEWAIDEARGHGAALIQCTSDRSRVDAHRFYERLGFEATHVGFKLAL